MKRTSKPKKQNDQKRSDHSRFPESASATLTPVARKQGRIVRKERETNRKRGSGTKKEFEKERERNN